MKKFFPLVLLLVFFIFIYREVFFANKVAIPSDTLVGSYYPWLDYQWGFSTGVPVKNPPISDAFSQFFIWKHLTIDYFKQGIVPLWNPFEFSGTPFLASFHTSVFFPANLLLFLPRFWGWNLYVFSSSFLAAVFMYFYLNRFIKSVMAKIAGSIIFALAGPMTTWVEFGTGVWAAALIPLILFSLDKYLIDKQKKYLFYLAFLIAFVVFAGHVQIAIYLSFLIPFYLLFRHTNKNQFITSLCFCLLGVGLSAIQLLPTLSFFPDSIRSNDSFASAFNHGLIPWYEMIRLWLADFFGNPSTYNHWSPLKFYHEYASFLGTLSLPLILSVIFSKKLTTEAKFFRNLFLITLVFVIDSPLSQFIFSLPLPLLTFSFASRILFITSLSGAVLVAISLDNFKSRPFVFWSVLISLITLLAILFVPKEYKSISLHNIILPLAQLILFFILIILKFKRQFLIFLFLLFLIFDLSRFFRKHTPFVSENIVFPKTPVIEFLQNQQGVFRIARANTNLLPPNSWEMYKLESIEGYNPLRLLSYHHLFSLANNRPYWSQPSRFAQIEDFDPRYFDILNVRFFLDLNSSDSPFKAKLTEFGFHPVFTDGHVIVYENPAVKQRAFFANQVKPVDDESKLVEMFQNPDFDPRQQVILTQDPKIKFTPPQAASVKISSYSAQKIIINTDSTTTNLLVLANSYDKAWQATIDNQPTRILVADGALQSVIVPNGAHQIIFTYNPSSFQQGIILSVLSLLSLIIFIFLRKWPKQFKFVLTFFIPLIFLITLILRFISVSSSNLPFNFDQARDMLSIRSIVLGFKPALVGPTTSINGVFLGPFWYYFNIPGFILGRGDPKFLVYWQIFCFQLIGFLFWFFTRKQNLIFAFLVSLFFLLAPEFFYLSRFSWNANAMPIFTLLFFLILINSFKNPTRLKSFCLGLIAGLSFQVEAAFAVLFFPFALVSLLIKRVNKNSFFSVFSGFFVTLIPQIIFELRHQFPMTKIFLAEFSGQSDILGERLSLNERLIDRWSNFHDSLYGLLRLPTEWTIFIFSCCLILVIFLLVTKRLDNLSRRYSLVAISYVLISFLFYLFFPNKLKSWYVSSLLVPFIFILATAFSWLIKQKFKIITIFLTLLISYITFSQLKVEFDHASQASRVTSSDRSNLSNELAVIDYIYQQSAGKPFKVYSYLPGIYDHPYQYLFWWYGAKKYGYQPDTITYLDNVPEYVKDNDRFFTKRKLITDNNYLVFLIIEEDPDHPQFISAWRNNFEKYCLQHKQNFPWTSHVEILTPCVK